MSAISSGYIRFWFVSTNKNDRSTNAVTRAPKEHWLFTLRLSASGSPPLPTPVNPGLVSVGMRERAVRVVWYTRRWWWQSLHRAGRVLFRVHLVRTRFEHDDDDGLARPFRVGSPEEIRRRAHDIISFGKITITIVIKSARGRWRRSRSARSLSVASTRSDRSRVEFQPNRARDGDVVCKIYYNVTRAGTREPGGGKIVRHK